MKIAEFCQEMIQDLARFHAWWVVEHIKDPESFPMEFPDWNAGAWQEHFLAYTESRVAYTETESPEGSDV